VSKDLLRGIEQRQLRRRRGAELDRGHGAVDTPPRAAPRSTAQRGDRPSWVTWRSSGSDGPRRAGAVHHWTRATERELLGPRRARWACALDVPPALIVSVRVSDDRGAALWRAPRRTAGELRHRASATRPISSRAPSLASRSSRLSVSGSTAHPRCKMWVLVARLPLPSFAYSSAPGSLPNGESFN
jgi:hypothetical protein